MYLIFTYMYITFTIKFNQMHVSISHTWILLDMPFIQGFSPNQLAACVFSWSWLYFTSLPTQKRNACCALWKGPRLTKKGKSIYNPHQYHQCLENQGMWCGHQVFWPKKIASIKRNFVDKHLHDTWGILLTSQSKPFAPAWCWASCRSAWHIWMIIPERTRSSPELMMRV